DAENVDEQIERSQVDEHPREADGQESQDPGREQPCDQATGEGRLHGFCVQRCTHGVNSSGRYTQYLPTCLSSSYFVRISWAGLGPNSRPAKSGSSGSFASGGLSSTIRSNSWASIRRGSSSAGASPFDTSTRYWKSSATIGR